VYLLENLNDQRLVNLPEDDGQGNSGQQDANPEGSILKLAGTG
jgi:hypothetical protein